MCLTAARTQSQQFGTIHNFHRFIHRLLSAKTPLEPVNLGPCWTLLWITCADTGHRSTGRSTASEMGWQAKFPTAFVDRGCSVSSIRVTARAPPCGVNRVSPGLLEGLERVRVFAVPASISQAPQDGL
jgi:hypothetical protein